MNRTIDLCGTWKLRWTNFQRGGRPERYLAPDADLSRAIEAAVPGEVHLDLMRAGLIDEPGVGLNCLRARWVEEFAWYYRRTFEAPPLAAGERAYLVFQTLDLAAEIYLNGVRVGRHANAFRPCRIDVTANLKPGRNVLMVQLESGLYHAADRPAEGYGMHPDHQLQKRQWLRQVQSSFGWDWSERLLNVGIRGPVHLEVCAGARYDGMVALAEVPEDLSRGSVVVRAFVEGLEQQAGKAELSVRVVGPDGREAAAAEVQGLEVRRGGNRVEAKVEVDGPRLWWPVNHGPQDRYTVEVRVTVDGRLLAEDSRRVGFRRAVVNQSPHPDGGQYFVIEINNKPVFCKGANFVPADLILARLDRARYETHIARALEANCNCLRVWGGGLYESDDFYDLCDEKGILVWQEFIFACAKYPGFDKGFYDEVAAEAVGQVRRLAHHPSLVVWCGNNELDMIYGRPDRQVSPAYPDYALFRVLLPRIVRDEDGTRFYWPSSPASPGLEDPNADNVGDQHPWSIGFSDTDFRKYRAMACRFPNEGGILGPTALPTVRACLEPGEDRPGSMAWEIHDNSVNYWGLRPFPDDMLVEWLGMSIADMSLADYVFYAGALQGEGMGEYVRNFRRRMFSTASAIFWMYNDCWPMVRSWTIVDYYLRRTPAYWAVRRAFAPLTVALAVEGERVKVFGVNEGPAWKGRLRYGLFALAGGLPVDRTADVDLPANASAPLAEFPLDDWRRLGETTHGAFAILTRDGRDAARDRLFLPLLKELRWPKAQLSVRRQGRQAVFESPTFIWRVCLDLDGEKALPDNFFDILPGIPTILDWPEDLGEPKVLRVGNLVQ